MPRQLRIEYPGAIYHAMARGDRREDIVLDDTDRTRFVQTLSEVVEKSGWHVYGWVLMSNHYHLVFETPEANLVEGMRWLQNTWTRRFNARHRLWGHLFGGRYKAILVGEGDYLARLIHYVHLNPVRAGLVGREDGIEAYGWSSLKEYLKPVRRRVPWVAVERGFWRLELPDTVAGRKRLLEWTERIVDWERPREAGAAVGEGQSLQSTMRRGWYFGAEAFRERLLGMLEGKAGEMSKRRSRGYGGEQARDYGTAEAERVIKRAEQVLEVSPAQWRGMKKGDWRKGLVAGLIRRRALVDNGWIAERLSMGARNAVSRTIHSAEKRGASEIGARRMRKLIANLSKSFD